MVRVLEATRPERPVDVLNLIVQTVSTDAAHGSAQRLRPEQLAGLYRFHEYIADPTPGPWSPWTMC